MTSETFNAAFGVPYPDHFDARHDEPVYGLALTDRAVELLHGLVVDVDDADGVDVVGDGGAVIYEMPCEHPSGARIALHDDLPADDPDQIYMCTECSTERAGWAPC